MLSPKNFISFLPLASVPIDPSGKTELFHRPFCFNLRVRSQTSKLENSSINWSYFSPLFSPLCCLKESKYPNAPGNQVLVNNLFHSLYVEWTTIWTHKHKTAVLLWRNQRCGDRQRRCSYSGSRSQSEGSNPSCPHNHWRWILETSHARPNLHNSGKQQTSDRQL